MPPRPPRAAARLPAVVPAFALCAAARTPVPPLPPCATDDDCSLNGVCGGGTCECDAQWRGADCAELAVLPTPPGNGYAEANSSSWGGSIIGPDAAGTWHMFAARMTGGCGLTSWKSNSEVVRAAASSPLGPYTRQETVVERFAHNPTVHQLGNGSYALYMIGCGGTTTPAVTNCSNGTTHGGDGVAGSGAGGAGAGSCGPHWTGMWTAPSLLGPWAAAGEVTVSPPPAASTNTWTTNPAVWYEANGTSTWLFRQPAGSWPAGGSSERIGVATGVTWDATHLVDRSVDSPLFDFALEDMYLWRDHRGNYHAATHKKKPGYGPKDGDIGHLFSRDGLQWRVSWNALAGSAVPLTDGTTRQYGKRARPQLVIVDGRPKYLSTGTGVGGAAPGDHTVTVVQPVAGWD